MPYYHRHIESVINTALSDTPVVCLLGARQVGKTTLAQRLQPEREYINFDNQQILAAAKADPLGFVEGLTTPVTLDEIQRVPELMPAIKIAVDQQRTPGRFLLTGSANLLLLPSVQESLAGRIEIIRIQPLTALEKHQGRRFLISDMLEGKLKTKIHEAKSTKLQLAEAICFGGYPEAIKRSQPRANRWFAQYLDTIIERDVKDIAVIQDQVELKRLVELLGLRTARLLNMSSLANELRLERRTVERYIAVLEKLFLIHRLPAWHRNTARRLLKTPKVHMVDSGLACSLNRVSVETWNNHATEFGHLLETFVVQQLITQSTWLDENLTFSHYRDRDQVEVDLVVERGTEVWGIEVKRAAVIQSGDGKGLHRLAAQAGKKFKGGILLYGGQSSFPLEKSPGCFAVPLSRLWMA